MAGTLQLKIVTPTGTLFEGEVESCTAPGTAGAFAVLAEHVGFLTSLVSGPLSIVEGGETRRYAIGPGFLESSADSVTLLTAWSLEAESLSPETVQAGLAKAEEKLGEIGPDNPSHGSVLQEVEDARGKVATLA